jgi:hypothetical protein
LPFIVAKIQMSQTVEELEKEICTLTDIPHERLVILLRHEDVNHQVRCEYFNMDWRKTKTLKETSKFEHGWTLFVEDVDLASTKFDAFKWKQEFSAEVERLTLVINNPRTDPDAESFNVKVNC